jgi:hypothetical protein
MFYVFLGEVHVLRCVLIKFTTFDQDATCMHAVELNTETSGELTLPLHSKICSEPHKI